MNMSSIFESRPIEGVQSRAEAVARVSRSASDIVFHVKGANIAAEQVDAGQQFNNGLEQSKGSAEVCCTYD